MAAVDWVKLWEKGKELDTSMKSQECQCNWQTVLFNVKFIGLSSWAIWALSPPNWLHCSGFLSVSVTGYQSASAPYLPHECWKTNTKPPTFYPYLCIQCHYFRWEYYPINPHRNSCASLIEGQHVLTHTCWLASGGAIKVYVMSFDVSFKSFTMGFKMDIWSGQFFHSKGTIQSQACSKERVDFPRITN